MPPAAAAPPRIAVGMVQNSAGVYDKPGRGDAEREQRHHRRCRQRRDRQRHAGQRHGHRTDAAGIAAPVAPGRDQGHGDKGADPGQHRHHTDFRAHAGAHQPRDLRGQIEGQAVKAHLHQKIDKGEKQDAVVAQSAQHTGMFTRAVILRQRRVQNRLFLCRQPGRLFGPVVQQEQHGNTAQRGQQALDQKHDLPAMQTERVMRHQLARQRPAKVSARGAP